MEHKRLNTERPRHPTIGLLVYITLIILLLMMFMTRIFINETGDAGKKVFKGKIYLFKK